MNTNQNKYTLKFSETFRSDLKHILNYLLYNLENPIAAHNLNKLIERKINDRLINPTAYEVFNSNRKRKHNYYRIYVKNYIIFYIVKDNTMEVRRILYSRRNFKHFL